MAEQKNKKPNSTNNENKPAFNFYWIYAIIAVILIGFTLFDWEGGTRKTTEQEFKTEMLEKNHVEKIIVVDRKMVKVFIKSEYLDSSFHKDRRVNQNKSLLGNKNIGPHYHFNVLSEDVFNKNIEVWEEEYQLKWETEESNTLGRDLLWTILPFALLIGFWIFMMRRMTGGGGGGASQIFNIGKSKAQVFGQGKGTNVSFKDVAGLEEAKEEIQEIVDFLKNPKKYTDLGAKIPKGALLVGPPGTGKTLLAKAVAGEAKVPFFSLSGSDFVEMFVGVGASRVRDLFRQAKEKAPCIIFIDEIDAIGRARGRNANMGSNDEHENTLNQLLTEMDGFGTNSGVIILAATNRADVLDKALLRAGRFDRQIYVDMPDLNERRAILDVHLRPLKLKTELDRDFLARQTPGFSGADLANVCNEAALIAARKKKTDVEMQDFLDAIDRIVGGLEKKNKIITPEEKRAIAFHEAGHATVSWMCEYANPLIKVTIVPRGRSLGAAWYLPEERSITTTEQILDEMCAALGGRAAEKLIFGKISTGALSDLEKVTKQAMAMVTIYGLNEKIGNISYYDPQERYGFTKPYSESTAKTIDEEVKNIVEIQYQRALTILKDNRDKLTQLAEALLQKEVIFKEDLERIFGQRPSSKLTASVPNTPPVATPDTGGFEIPKVPEINFGNTDSMPSSPKDEPSTTDNA
jgi:cell division protease FtsH